MPHCQARWADKQSQKRCSTVSWGLSGQTGHLVSIAWCIFPLQALTATARCQINHNNPASFGMRAFVQTVFHFSRCERGRIPCHLRSTTFGKIYLSLRSQIWKIFFMWYLTNCNRKKGLAGALHTEMLPSIMDSAVPNPKSEHHHQRNWKCEFQSTPSSLN